MKKQILWLAVMSSLAFGETTLQFGSESNVNENEYGERTSQTSVTVKTSNFQIDRFWHKFKKGSGNDALDVSMDTTIDIDLVTRSSFLCKKYKLESEGCSGQKPLLINDKTLQNSQLKFDKDNNPLPSGEYRIPFDSADHYDPNNKDAFYALDVYRDMKYYLPNEGTTEDSNEPTNFFGKIIAFFRDYFSHDVTIYGNNLDDPKSRQRYIANLIYGAQQSYRMKKSVTAFSTEYNSADGSSVSLLDYSQDLHTNTSGCSGLIFDYDPNSLTCKIVNFFSMSKWMPFVDTTDVTTVDTKSVLEDTEATLLTLAGANDNKSYVVPKLSEKNGKKGFFGQIFKPVTFMAGSMFRFFFGDETKKLTEMFELEFNFDNPIALTFATTDGNKITGFEHFKLLGLESVYGTQVESCEVKLKDYDKLQDFMKFWLSFGFAPKVTAYIKENGSSSKWRSGHTTTFTKNSSKKVEFVTRNFWDKLFGKVKDRRTITADQWVSWCKRNQGVTKRSLLGRLTDSTSSFINDLLDKNKDDPYYNTEDGKIDKMLNCSDSWSQFKQTWSRNNQDVCFTVETYKEKVNKGLILHLKHINPQDLHVGTPGTHTEYTIRDIRRNGSAKSKPDMKQNGNGGMHK